jgi:hypothetical protein
MYAALLDYVKDRLLAEKSEVRIALVLKPFSRAKQSETRRRVSLMTVSRQSVTAYQRAINKEESVLFADTDKDGEEQSIKPAEARVNPEASLLQSQSSLRETSGSFKKPKPFDKTKRAFSISIESSKAFELAIRKPRTQCKHYGTRARSFLYGLFLMFVRQTGSHPNVKDLTPWFVTYSAVLSLDLIMLINYSLHIWLPMANFLSFGWAFVVWVAGAPYIASILGFLAAFYGDVWLM